MNTNNNEPSGQKNSVPQRKYPDDPSNDPGANEYGFQDVFSSRAGHNLTFSDVDGKEYIRLQHRSGSGWIYNPDGSAKMTVFNGFYNDIRGEMVINTSGDFDLRSERHGSLRTEGSFDVTTTTTNMTSSDSTNISFGSNLNATGGGKINMVGKGFQVFSTSDGPINMSTSGAGIEMSGGNVTLHAKEQQGGLASFAGQQVSIKAEQSVVAIGAKTSVSVSVEGGNVYIDGGGGNVYINSGPGVKPQDMKAPKLNSEQQISAVTNPYLFSQESQA